MILLFACLMSQEINFRSQLDYTVSRDKKGRWFSFWTSDSHSSWTESLDLSLTGENQSTVQEIIVDGKKLKGRMVKWDSAKGENFFYLNFYNQDGEASSYSKDSKWDRKYIEKIAMQTEKNILSATTSFLIPANVWVIKITVSGKNIKQDETFSIDLYNKKYKVDDNSTLEADENGLVQTKLPSFASAQDYYYIVNPSTSDFDNFITLNVISDHVGEKHFNLDFKISFIAVENCLSNFNGIKPVEVLEELRHSTDSNKNITSLACLLTPSYVEYILYHLYLIDLDYFFKILDETREFYYQKTTDKTTVENTAITIHELLKYVSFYYSYEISKDIMKLAETKREGGMSDLDVLLSFKMFDSTYIMRALDIFYAEIEKIEEQSTSLSLSIEEDNKKNLHYMNNVLIEEFRNIEMMVNKLPTTEYLAKSRFLYLKEITNNLLSKFNIYQNIFTSLLTENNSENMNITYDLRRSVKELIYSFNNYRLSWNDLFGNKEKEEPLTSSYNEFMKTVEELFALNLLDLKERLNPYFLKHFEADQFIKTMIGTKNYTDPSDFINEFTTMVEYRRN